MRLIENASGGRRALVFVALLACSWVAAVLAIGVVGGTLASFAHAPSIAQAPPFDLTQFLASASRKCVELVLIATNLTIAPLIPSSWDAPSSVLLGGMTWLAFAAIVAAPALIATPLVGMRTRRRLPLRWSIAGGGLLGGLIGVGVILSLIDLIRLLDWTAWLEVLPPLFGSSRVGTALRLFTCWMVSGGPWAWALARAGRSGHPDAITRFVRRLFAGTCVELAIAAPTYAVSVRRSDCWCSWGSWFAVVAGAAILTVLCGPMLVLLCTRGARLQWLRNCCRGCGYPLRTGSNRCPECGKRCDVEVAA